MAPQRIGPGGPTYVSQERETEIVWKDDRNFHLYGQVEMTMREGQRERAWTENLVARGYDRDNLRIVKTLSVGDKVLATFQFIHRDTEWVVRSVRRLEERKRSDLRETFPDTPAKVVLRPALAVRLTPCGAVVRLGVSATYYEGDDKVPFLWAKSLLEARGADAPVRVDAALYGKSWHVTNVYLPALSSTARRRSKERPVLPFRVPQDASTTPGSEGTPGDAPRSISVTDDVPEAEAAPDSEGASGRNPEASDSQGASTDTRAEALDSGGCSIDKQEVDAPRSGEPCDADPEDEASSAEHDDGGVGAEASATFFH